MKNPIKGSRCDRKASMDGAPAEEAFGPPAAIPFKWEEAPGKAKPSEEEPRALQIKRDGDLYDLLLRKGDSLGHSSGSLYRSADPGSIPFEWEAEPGKPKTPARAEMLLPLSPPPGLQSPAWPASPVKATSARRWSSQSLIKWIFHNQNKAYSGPMNIHISACASASASQELGTTKLNQISALSPLNRIKSSNGRLEFGSATSFSSCSSHMDSSTSQQESGWLLHTNSSNSRNSDRPDTTGQSCLRRESSSKIYMLEDEKIKELKGNNAVQSRYTVHKDDRGQKLLDDENDKGLEFGGAVSEFFESEEGKEEIKSVPGNAAADKKKEVMADQRAEISMELEILMRFAQVNFGNKKATKMHARQISGGGLLSCLPSCSFTPRPSRIYEDEDRQESINSHWNAVSRSNDLDRGF